MLSVKQFMRGNKLIKLIIENEKNIKTYKCFTDNIINID